MTRPDDEERPTYASPPCFMHELDPAHGDERTAGDVQERRDVMRWRKAERERLIAERLAIDAQVRRRHGERIAEGLERLIGEADGLTISLYWPFRGEPDLRGLMERLAGRGAHCALPVVVARGRPLLFRAWSPGAKLMPGVWNIPVPADGAEVVPDVVVAPVVGFDRACYRLGYGGGFFDRTLAALPAKPRLFGVGYGQAAIATIYPQPHDIPMDAVVTEAGVARPR